MVLEKIVILNKRNNNAKTMENRKDVVFITKDIVPILTRKSDIILSPEFYWVIKKKLHIKHLWQVKKICPSLFDGMLSEGDYEYRVIKTEEAFLIFAYDSGYILNHLKKMGINTDFIDTIHFAQNELAQNSVYRIGDKMLIAKNGIFMLLPKALVSIEGIEIKHANFERLSSIKISLDKYNLLIDKKSFKLIVISLILYSSFLFFEILQHHNNLTKIHNMQNELYQTYHIPPTSWQIASIKKKLLSKHLEQTTLRDTIQQVFETPLAKGDFFTSLYFEKKEIAFTISLKELEEAEKIKKNLSHLFTLKSAKIQNNSFVGELIRE